MTSQDIMQVLGAYSKALQARGYASQRYEHPSNGDIPTPKQRRFHAAWMCLQAISFAFEGRDGKSNRWLGFIQGVLWCEGFYTIEEMKEHNRSKEPSETPNGGVLPTEINRELLALLLGALVGRAEKSGMPVGEIETALNAALRYVKEGNTGQ